MSLRIQRRRTKPWRSTNRRRLSEPLKYKCIRGSDYPKWVGFHGIIARRHRHILWSEIVDWWKTQLRRMGCGKKMIWKSSHEWTQPTCGNPRGSYFYREILAVLSSPVSLFYWMTEKVPKSRGLSRNDDLNSSLYNVHISLHLMGLTLSIVLISYSTLTVLTSLKILAL